MASKFISTPENVVPELLQGMLCAHGHLNVLEGAPKINVIFDKDSTPSSCVVIISGGGSGHEPAHAGFVGRGMLSAAVCGDVFASPPAQAVLAAIRTVTGPPGCLLIVKNYTGDRIQFGLAAEQAKLEGFKVDMVIVDEDCAIHNAGVAGRRGLAGTVFVHKVAGAAAAAGKTLEEVVDEAQKVVASMATFGVALSVGTLPGQRPSERLLESEMELGLGIHGEPGCQKMHWESVDKLVPRMLDAITNASNFRHLRLGEGCPVALLANNLGATSGMEMSIVAHHAVQYATKKLKLALQRVYVGSFMTSLDMAGMSLTLMRVTPDMLGRLDAPTSAPAWPSSSTVYAGERAAAPVPASDVRQRDPQADGMKLSPHQQELLRRVIRNVAQKLIEASEQLNAWDARVGDGDCGSTIKKAAESFLADSNQYKLHTPTCAANAISQTLQHSVGGTTGSLYVVLLSAASRSLEAGSAEIGAVQYIEALQEGIQAVQKYGGAKQGQRTMLDALVPAAQAGQQLLSSNPGARGGEVAMRMASAAQAGADSTRRMTTAAGRSGYVPASVLADTPDPGAMAAATWLQAVADTLHEGEREA